MTSKCSALDWTRIAHRIQLYKCMHCTCSQQMILNQNIFYHQVNLYTNKVIRDGIHRPAKHPIFNNSVVHIEHHLHVLKLQFITSLKQIKNCGKDNINNTFRKKISTAICLPISTIINMSLQSGNIPTSIKSAQIIPIYKANEKNILNNYRPIFLLPNISKILERVVHRRVYIFMEQSGVVYKDQFGFRSRHTTTDAVSVFCNDTLKSFNKNETTFGVFLDLSKAFDTIDHTIQFFLWNKRCGFGVVQKLLT